MTTTPPEPPPDPPTTPTTPPEFDEWLAHIRDEIGWTTTQDANETGAQW